MMEKMRITEEQLITTLKELKEHYWKVRKQLHDSDDESPEHSYMTGKADGAGEAVDAILLQVIGGKELLKIDMKHWEGQEEPERKKGKLHQDALS